MNYTEFYVNFGHLFPKNLSLLRHINNPSLKESFAMTDDVLFSGHEPGTIALIVIYALSFIVGLVGNVMALRVLTKKRRTQLIGVSATRSLLINLAVCDMMVLCICMPVNLGHQVYKAWVFGDFLCRAVPFVQAVSVSASVLSLAVISLNRFYSVHNPLNARYFFTWRKICWMVGVVWTLSSGLCVPLAFMNKTKRLELPDRKQVIDLCVENWPYFKLRQAYNFLLFCTLYGFPVLFNLIICFLTIRKLWNPDDKLKEYNKCTFAQLESRLKVRKKVAKMVVALVVLFTLSWLPLYVVDIWIDLNLPNGPLAEDVGFEQDRHEWIVHLRPFAQWLGLTNSALNPLCYCFVGNLYRSAKKFRRSYGKKMSSVFNLSLSQSQGSTATPMLISYRYAHDNPGLQVGGWKECDDPSSRLTKSKSISSVTVCETVFG
ncbi:galanin receptor 2a [Erpetoichthys calabaricus]|uniref:galanin receptor 2a n=1 Tax=Erpetoichthys calabaricus TaxID=27687 RepID=UPI002234BCAF|nr:galanin receptor 2a [Erpetoichthys calabaricus]